MMVERIDRKLEVRDETIPQAIKRILTGRVLTARELSQEIGKSEKVIYGHLEKLVKYKNVIMIPPECSSCGFVFSSRDRAAKPGKCPRCRKTRIEPPRFTRVPDDHRSAEIFR